MGLTSILFKNNSSFMFACLEFVYFSIKDLDKILLRDN